MSTAVNDVDPANSDKKPGHGILSPRMDPMMGTICPYGAYLQGPDKEWSAHMLGRSEFLASEELPGGQLRVLLGFPRSGSGALVFLLDPAPGFLPRRVEWKMTPDAKPTKQRPRPEIAMQWPTHDTVDIEWQKVGPHWVPKRHEHLQSFLGVDRRYAVELRGWKFDKKEFEELLTVENFSAVSPSKDDFVEVAGLFEE